MPKRTVLMTGATGYIAKPVEERALILEVAQWTGPVSQAKR